MQVASFAYYYANGGEGVAIESIFIYRPDRKREIWRFFLYMLLHAGYGRIEVTLRLGSPLRKFIKFPIGLFDSWLHVAFNVVVQILVGLPLEMVHGSLRIAAIYMAGVLAGSLGTSVMDPGVYLVGASGGVYALLAAHLANVLLNYHHMHCGVVRLLGVFAIASADVGFAVYNRYAGGGDGVGGAPPVSFVAHLAGALAGLTIGLIVLKNFGQNLHEKLIWWVGLGVYMACTLFAILYNVFSDTSSRAVFLDDIPKDNFVFVEPVPLGSLS
ncbi:unnamed protein product [Darwinula stevensoni]|uniref:Peptidase S54 rhomboid domain-containing protein n=1 Tax=Darwinula stevensoni TaxID=69355 RepID=A0A7R8X6S9_9CRUS|nr:unnamed protein product [Darwinula stevensoni]CAG0881606.1 unnamed protein product [Darwinula stevensoni]